MSCVSCQAGIIEEMTDDMFASTMDDDELDEEATEEVDKILWEITAGKGCRRWT